MLRSSMDGDLRSDDRGLRTAKFNQTTVSNVMHVGGICTSGIFLLATRGNRTCGLDSISIARGEALLWPGPTKESAERSPDYLVVAGQSSAIVGQIRAKAARSGRAGMSNENNEN